MAFNYDSSDLATDLNAIRFAIGDTVDRSPFSLDDAEITYILTIQPQLGYAASEAARRLAGKYSVQADTKNSELSVTASQRYDHLMDLADKLGKNPELFTGKKSASPVPFLGGMRQSENDVLDEDTNARQPYFKHGRFDNQGTSPQLDGDFEDG